MCEPPGLGDLGPSGSETREAVIWFIGGFYAYITLVEVVAVLCGFHMSTTGSRIAFKQKKNIRKRETEGEKKELKWKKKKEEKKYRKER